jgi:hypothetical protein
MNRRFGSLASAAATGIVMLVANGSAAAAAVPLTDPNLLVAHLARVGAAE